MSTLSYPLGFLDDLVLGSYMFDKDRQRGLSEPFTYNQLIVIKHKKVGESKKHTGSLGGNFVSLVLQLGGLFGTLLLCCGHVPIDDDTGQSDDTSEHGVAGS